MDRFVCYCFGVTDEEIRHAIVQHKLQSIDNVLQQCGAGRGCGCCRFDIEDILTEIRDGAAGANDGARD